MEKKAMLGVTLTLLLLCMFYEAFEVGPGVAWDNGGFSSNPSNPNYGTHDWIAQHALDWLPSEEKQYILDNLAGYLYGTELPDNGGAPDGIGDTVKHHVYYFANGSLQDDASAIRAQEEYNKAFKLLKQGDLSNAAKRAGIMSHYIADVAAFGHVMASGTAWGPEVHHSDYESYVEERTNNYADEFNTYLSFDGSLNITSAYEATCRIAYDTTFDGDGNLTCVWMDQNYNWSNPTFKNRAGGSLNLAVNYLADVLHTLYVAETKLYVSPTLVEYWTPVYGSIFTIDVKVLNVEELYGFEFKLYWNTTLLDLIDAKITPPSDWGANYFIGMNQIIEDLGSYWLAVAATDPAPSFYGGTALAKLTFKTTYDPIFPNDVTSILNLTDTELSDPEANPIPHDVYDGEYWCYATKPKLKAEPQTYTAIVLGEEFTVEITIADVVNLYSFEFQLIYNTTLLDATAIAMGSFLKSPYRVVKQNIDDVTGVIWLSVESQMPAPSANGSGILTTITFKVSWESGIWYKGYVPLQCDLHLNNTILKTDQSVIIPHDTADPLIHYVYMPIPGDLNSDRIVNIFDLRIVARAFGSSPSASKWDPRADLNRDDEINIYDLVLVAKNYGRTTP